MKIDPIGGRVLIRPLKQDSVTKGGVVLPETSKEKPQEGIVLEIGSGKILGNGNTINTELKIGDRVLYGKYAGNETFTDGEELLIMQEEEILAILN